MHFEQVINAISTPRLSYYEHYLGYKDKYEKVGAYLAFQDLSGDFFPIVQMIEVGLRNAINEVAKKHFSSDSWFEHVPQTKQSKDLVGAARDKALNECGARYSDDDIICRLSLGFWVYMLDAPYRDTSKRDCYLWTPANKEYAFGDPKNPWGARTKIPALFDDFQKLLKLRNRLFHHEPIWKKHNCKDVNSAVLNMGKEYSHLLKLLGYVSPGKVMLLGCIDLPSRFNIRCEAEHVINVIEKVKVALPEIGCEALSELRS